MLMAAVIQTACSTRADMFIEKFLCDVCSSHDLHIGLVCAQWRGEVEESLAGVGSVYALLVNTCHSSVTFTLEFSVLTKINSEMYTFGTLKLVWLRYDFYLPTSTYH